MQPADSDVIAPFFPIELGGDGLFTDNPKFLQAILEEKKLRGGFTDDFNSLVQSECRYRIKQVLDGKHQGGYLRSEKLIQSTGKYHMWIQEDKKLLSYLERPELGLEEYIIKKDVPNW